MFGRKRNHDTDTDNIRMQEQSFGMGSDPVQGSEPSGAEEGTKRTTRKDSRKKKAMKFTALALSFGVLAGSSFAGTTYVLGKTEATSSSSSSGSVLKTSYTATSTASSSSGDDGTVSTVAENVMPSIVSIAAVSVSEYNSIFRGQSSAQSESQGSGIIVSKDDTYLYVATNNHVVSGASTLTVQFCDDSTVSAELQGQDASNDLAVIKIKLSDISSDTLSAIKVATLGDSDSLKVGDTAIAIGNALGYGQSVTSGVISALNREVSSQDETTGQTTTSTLIQTDASINPGNSGGALLNARGEVIGITSAKFSDTSVEGMGFAIPINTAKTILEDLIKNGTTTTTTTTSGSQSGSYGGYGSFGSGDDIDDYTYSYGSSDAHAGGVF